MAVLPHVIDEKDIIRGRIFRTAFPFLEERPLSFFERCPEYVKCKHHGKGHDYCGKVTEKPYGFESCNDEILFVVNRFKARHAVVLSTPVLNNNRRWPNVIVAPLVGIHDDELKKPNIIRIMQRDISMFTTYYLDKSITGMHCYIDLGKIRPIPKNWLLQEKSQIDEPQMFDDISERLGLILVQKKLAECENCTKPCEKCEIKEELEQLRIQLKNLGA